MGRKQREKKARQQQQQTATRPSAAGKPASKSWLPWLLTGLGVVIVTAVGLTIYYVSANRAKLFQVALYTQAVQLQGELAQRQGIFTLAEGRRLADVLVAVQRLSGDSGLDLQVGGHLNFVLQVEKEIIKNGNLEPGELDKLESLVSQAAVMLGRKSRQAKPGPKKP